MKKASTLIQPRGWMSIIGRSVFLVLLTFCFGVNLQAQTVLNADNAGACGDEATPITGCTGEYSLATTDGLYNDNMDASVWTFCPSDPTSERIKLTFSEFDIHEDDVFSVSAECGVNLTAIEGNSPGSMTVPGAQPAGLKIGAEVEATCDNAAGCVTVSWAPNGDDNKGKGFSFSVSCSSRAVVLECPNYDKGAADCGGTDDNFMLFAAEMGDGSNCAGSSVYIVQVSVNGTLKGSYDLADNLGTVMIPAGMLPAGVHTVSYQVFYDIDGDGAESGEAQGDPVSCDITIQDEVDLVGNNNLNVSLGVDCWTELSLDDVLEGYEDLVTNGTLNTGYKLSVSGASSDNSGNFSPNPADVTVQVQAGTYQYIVEDECGNKIGGTINVVDFQGPACPGPIVTSLGCSDDLPEAEDPGFNDCNEYSAPTHGDVTIGDGCDLDDDDIAVLGAALGLSDAGIQVLKDLAAGKTVETVETGETVETVEPAVATAFGRLAPLTGSGSGATTDEILEDIDAEAEAAEASEAAVAAEMAADAAATAAAGTPAEAAAAAAVAAAADAAAAAATAETAAAAAAADPTNTELATAAATAATAAAQAAAESEDAAAAAVTAAAGTAAADAAMAAQTAAAAAAVASAESAAAAAASAVLVSGGTVQEAQAAAAQAAAAAGLSSEELMLVLAGLNLEDELGVENSGVFQLVDGTLELRGDATISIPAGMDLVGATIRYWKTEDVLGNVTENCPEIFVRLRPQNVNLDGDDLDLEPIIEVACGAGYMPADLADTDGIAGYAPSYELNGTKYIMPNEHSTCGYAVTFNDTPVEACGNSKKIIRTWTLIDWCSEGLAKTTGTQIIHIVDNDAPTLVSGPEADTINLNSHECMATVVVGSASFEDDCGSVASNRTALVACSDKDGDGDTDATDLQMAIADGEVWIGNENGGTFEGITTGDYWGVIYATDECGNETSIFEGDDQNIHFYKITVEDNEAPQPQCEDNIVVSIGSNGDADNGWARIYAKDVDEGSFDNCTEVSLAVSTTEDGTFGEYVEFSCAAKDEVQYVYLQVSDENDNSSICWANITIQDKSGPTVTAPPAEEGSCEEYHQNVFEEGVVDADLQDYLNEHFNSFTYVDNCGEAQNPTETLSVEAGDCGSFVVTRTYTAEDWAGNSASATQIITITGTQAWKLTFPEDDTIECGEDFPEQPTADDIITEIGFCDRLSVNVEDQIFRGEADACMKLVRTFTVWNSCGEEGAFNVNTENGGGLMVTQDSTSAQRIVYVQTITADITSAPIIEIGDVELEIFGASNKGGAVDCSEKKLFEVWAGDCLNNDIPESGLTVYIISEAGDTLSVSTEYNAEGQLTLFADVTIGTYTVEAWAADGCGNSSGATKEFTFVDAKAPSIWALNGIVTEVMPNSGTIDVWASDFYTDIVDCSDWTVGIWHNSLGDAPADCTEAAALDQNVDFTCDHLGTQLVRIYAVDAAGQCDYVETYIIIQDNGNKCNSGPVGAIPESQVAGKIVNTSGDLVGEVNVAVNGSAMSDAMTTSAAGNYAFTLDNGNDYTITPEKNIQPLNGVSTFDLVLISKHILGVDEFDSPYQYIAADINNNGSITAFDIVQLRQLILNITSEFSNNTSWRFVDQSYDFGTDVATTLTQNFPEIMNINNLEADKLNNDFVAVKIGDVNGSAAPSNLVQSEVRNAAGTLVLTTADRYVAAGETVEVAFTSENIATATGYQFTMNYAGLELAELVEGVATASNFNTNLRSALTTSWNGEATANDVLFTVNFTATTNGALSELISVNSDITTAEAYSTTGEALDVALEFTGTATPANFSLEQNQPNPFNGETVIGFTLPQAGAATFKVMDVQGKLLKEITGDYVKGYNQISINAKTLGATGVLHYQLESADQTATRKMIIIE